MSFTANWHTLLEELDDLPESATLITPLSHQRFRITDVQDARVIIQFEDNDETRPLQRDQFGTLYRRIEDASGGFNLDRFPPDADPYPAVWSVHPQFEVDEDAGVITQSEVATATQVMGVEQGPTDEDRTEPDGLAVYSDALLLIDALERHDVTTLAELETDALVNLYTLLSDVQRDANDFRKEIADVLLARLHHDRPVSGQYGSVQRTSRRNRSLKDDAEVLECLENAGIDRERVLSVDRSKVDEALEVTTLSESDVYELEESEYVRKAEVDEDVKESRLQGLKDRLAASEDDEANQLRAEIEELEQRIDDLTSFRTGAEMEG
ncbi:hypothetical protein [Natronobacterium gregoryi]|uniref:DUF2800 domain-containing protein n=2 Tax=Natronobacterium gregoryi TaxID=44930 RepID=L0ABQ8_NATGS|nr:hypothetical protein [Natronobacterium gregoryi]AFZ71301.1 Protein of unknown function (DUF2800) [Natronobacterium gregoryi SP2]ELY67189.1 hypothetical protein C490_11306 [Natronobacterium gregoryi SP2]PLK19172.1 hypothetical protein CYV19_16200 [Natronobacterium gregoryi SP2]SFJ58742.1 hypothetical protein SAMN05443661_1433 [Natronobacterium gregoryi]